MAVPGHDQRDWEFADAFGLPIVKVVEAVGAAGAHDVAEGAYAGDGRAVNSANDEGLDIDGMDVDEAKATVIEWLEGRGAGVGTVQYKLRDWLFARQRYWGEPFPIVYDDGGFAHPLPESDLPVELPEVDEYRPVSFDPD